MLLTSACGNGRRSRGRATAKVASVVAVGGHDAAAVLSLAASLAPGLAPALAAAIVDAAQGRDIGIAVVDEFAESTPAGVVATVKGQSVAVGNTALFNKLQLSLEILGDGPNRLRRHGEHVMFVSIAGQIAGFFGVQDRDGKPTLSNGGRDARFTL